MHKRMDLIENDKFGRLESRKQHVGKDRGRGHDVCEGKKGTFMAGRLVVCGCVTRESTRDHGSSKRASSEGKAARMLNQSLLYQLVRATQPPAAVLLLLLLLARASLCSLHIHSRDVSKVLGHIRQLDITRRQTHWFRQLPTLILD